MSKGKPKGNPGENEKPAKLVAMRVSSFLLAETQGFEPWIRVLPRCALSRGVPSTTRPRLQKGETITHHPARSSSISEAVQLLKLYVNVKAINRYKQN